MGKEEESGYKCKEQKNRKDREIATKHNAFCSPDNL